MTLFRLALRLGRVGAIAAGVIGIAAAVAQPLAFAQLAGNTPAERALFAEQMEILARQLTYLLPLPHGLGTMAGWIEWRAIGALEVIFAFWAVMAGSGAGRGDEERGLVEHWLAQGVSRARYIAARIAAFALITTIVVTLTLAAAGVGSALGKEPVPASALALQGIALLGLVLCCYAIALFAAQLVTTRRGAVALGVERSSSSISSPLSPERTVRRASAGSRPSGCTTRTTRSRMAARWTGPRRSRCM